MKSVRFLLLLFVLVWPSLGMAQVPASLGNLCNAVEARNPDNDPTGFYEYRYQRIVYEAAGVEPATDSEDVIAEKVGRLWRNNRSNLTCSNMQFNVSNGSVLKFAASKTFTPFMEDAIQIWKLDFNYIDDADSRTLLDYIRDEKVRRKGSPNEKPLANYYAQLRKAGAKHASEL